MAESLHFSDLPSATTPPQGTSIPREVRRERSRLARREFMRVTGAAAVGTGLAFAGLFPTARPAHATHPRKWSAGCYGPRTTGHGYAGSTGCCACGSIVSGTMCRGGRWHRHDNGGCGAYRYRVRLRSCHGGGRPANAWSWVRGGTRWRCSDGQRKYCTGAQCTCGGWSNTVCPVIV